MKLSSANQLHLIGINFSLFLSLILTSAAAAPRTRAPSPEMLWFPFIETPRGGDDVSSALVRERTASAVIKYSVLFWAPVNVLIVGLGRRTCTSTTSTTSVTLVTVVLVKLVLYDLCRERAYGQLSLHDCFVV